MSLPEIAHPSGTGRDAGVRTLRLGESVGLGVVADRAFPRGSVILELSGRVSRELTQHSLQVTPELHIQDEGVAGWLSHSCAPNAILDMSRLQLLALCDIEEGEVVTIDYATTEDVLYRQFPCHCGAPTCRQWITGRRETVNAEGLRYLGSLAGGQRAPTRAAG